MALPRQLGGTTTHAPAEQFWPAPQPLPHEAQLAAVPSGVSQPSSSLFALQSPHPASQVPPHTLAAQAAPTTWLVEQALAQAPQCATLVERLVSQPVETAPSQSPQPTAQASLHAPARHVGVACVVLHALPHPPQAATLFVRLASHPVETAPSQSPQPTAQASLHALATHEGVACVVLHALPHPPQLLVLAVRLASHPFEASRSQSPQPAAQDLSLIHI